MSYVYRQSFSLFHVGFYKPDGTWEGETDWPTQAQAAQRVHYLNGGDAFPRANTNWEMKVTP